MLWDDVNARARGLATHLLDKGTLLRLAESRSWDAFIRDVLDLGLALTSGDGGTASPPEFDRAVGHIVAQRLSLLARWLGRRRGVLAVIYEDEERRTLRALLRGAAQGGSPGARLRAVTPTPGLPGRVLERLARVDSPAALAEELVRVGHPAGRALREAGLSESALGLLGLETALTRLFATRAARAARRGGPVIRQFVAELIDLENAWTLILGGGRQHSITGDALFVEGGEFLNRKTFLRLQATAELGELLAQLRALFARRGLGRIFAGEVPDPARIEARAFAARIAFQRDLARRNPLSPSVVLSVLERIRGEGRDLRTVAWGLALGAPAPAIEAQLVTAA
jgi:vacuolar-type H+-ATPase subunit C/Vma6